MFLGIPLIYLANTLILPKITKTNTPAGIRLARKYGLGSSLAYALIFYILNRNVVSEMTINEKKETVIIRHGLIVPHRREYPIKELSPRAALNIASNDKISFNAGGQVFTIPSLKKYAGVSLTHRQLLNSVLSGDAESVNKFKYALSH